MTAPSLELVRKPDRVECFGGDRRVQVSEASHSSWRRQVRASTTKKDTPTHVGSYDAVLCTLRRNTPEAVGFGRRGTAHLTAHGERIGATNEQVKLVPVLYTISRAMQDAGQYSLVRDSSTGGSDLGADLEGGELLCGGKHNRSVRCRRYCPPLLAFPNPILDAAPDDAILHTTAVGRMDLRPP